jgi:hypothetical protein
MLNTFFSIASLSIQYRVLIIQHRVIFNQKRIPLSVKIVIFENFLTALSTSSYENQESRIEQFFDSFVQVRAIIEESLVFSE